MITKSALLDYITDLEDGIMILTDKVNDLSCRVMKLEAKPKNICPCKKKKTSEEKAVTKRKPGRPKGSKNKTKK